MVYHARKAHFMRIHYTDGKASRSVVTMTSKCLQMFAFTMVNRRCLLWYATFWVSGARDRFFSYLKLRKWISFHVNWRQWEFHFGDGTFTCCSYFGHGAIRPSFEFSIKIRNFCQSVKLYFWMRYKWTFV